MTKKMTILGQIIFVKIGERVKETEKQALAVLPLTQLEKLLDLIDVRGAEPDVDLKVKFRLPLNKNRTFCDRTVQLRGPHPELWLENSPAKAWRKRKGVKVKSMADSLEMKPAAYRQWESHEHLACGRLLKVAEALGVPYAGLIAPAKNGKRIRRHAD